MCYLYCFVDLNLVLGLLDFWYIYGVKGLNFVFVGGFVIVVIMVVVVFIGVVNVGDCFCSKLVEVILVEVYYNFDDKVDVEV